MNTLQFSEELSLDLSEIIEEINKDIYDGSLTEIIEVTYTYFDDERWDWNKTLFWEFWWCDIGEDFSVIWEAVREKLKSKIRLVDLYVWKLKEYENLEEGYDCSEKSTNSAHIRHGILLESLMFTRRTLEMALIWLPFELEKAWDTLDLSDQEVEERVLRLEDLESQNFGGNVRDNPEEVALCHQYLQTHYVRNNEKLSHKDKVQFKKYLSELNPYLPEDYKFSPLKDHKDYFPESVKKALENKVLREDYSQDILTILNDFYHLDFDVTVEDGRGSIYDWEWEIAIPAMEKYKYMSSGRQVAISWHEIEDHSLNLRTTQAVLWNFRWAWSVEKEEWLAMWWEAFRAGKKLWELGVTQHFPKVLMWELLDSGDLERFLEINTILNPDPATAHKRMLRLNRNYPLNYRGAQHKDTSYTRWILSFQKFLLNGWDFWDYYLGKVAEKDLPKMKRIIELEWLESKVYKPMMVSELLLYHLYPISERPEKDFLTYLKNKYPFIDFKSQEVKILTMAEKKKVVDILWHLRHKYVDRNINTREKLWVDASRLHKS